MNDSNRNNIIESLKELAQKIKVSQDRCHSLKDELKEVLEMVNKHCIDLPISQYGAHDLDVIIESLRVLRNSCAWCPENQSLITKNPEVIKSLDGLMRHFCNQLKKDELHGDIKVKVITLLRCGVQFFGNACNGSVENSINVEQTCGDSFRDLLDADDVTLANYVCMVLQVCIHSDHGHLILNRSPELISIVLDLLSIHDIEWGLLLIEKMNELQDFFKTYWKAVSILCRCRLMDVLIEHLNRISLKKEDTAVHPTNIQYVTQVFIDSAHSILGLRKTNHATTDEESLLVSKELEVLCTITAEDIPFVIAPDEQHQLLKTVINLLHSIHMIGKESDNSFTSVSKVTELSKVDDQDPVFGLKKNLIRLIANMVYRNPSNQNKARDLGCIQLILNHTNIDGRNPFITQWAVLAIRNLMEDNEDNKAVIAGMKLEGMADNLEQLKEFGVDAELRDNQIIVKNVNPPEKSPFQKDT